jgi:acid phosphatase (class A)
MRRATFLLSLCLLLVPGLLSFSQDSAWTAKPYLTDKDLDIRVFVAPPPAADSAQTASEIEEILRFQAERTPSMLARAQADADLSVFRFADVLGPAFAPANLPVTKAFFFRVIATAGSVVDPAKTAWNRARPYVVDSRVQPCLAKPPIASYPSGHANAGYAMAIVLAQMVPEKRAELFARAAQFALQRVIGGVHYRSDIEAGELSGTLVASAMFRDHGFLADLAAARAETRKALGFPD